MSKQNWLEEVFNNSQKSLSSSTDWRQRKNLDYSLGHGSHNSTSVSVKKMRVNEKKYST